MTNISGPQDPHTPTTPAGWYPDSQGAMRWWNGTAWTDHVQQGTSPQPAPQTGAKTKKPWFKKPVWWAAAAVLAIVAAAGASGAGGDESSKDSPSAASDSSAPEPDEPVADSSDAEDDAEEAAPEEEPKPTKKPEPKFTVSQENAIESAQSYLDYAAFSEKGLIDQLSSKYGDGFPRKDAVFAVNHIKVDWNAEAVESAKSYLEFSSFSRQGLIEQLTSEYGDQFTMKQALYAVKKVGL